VRANLGFRSHSPCQHFPMRHPLLHTAVGALGRDHQSKSGETDAVFTRWSYPIVAFLLGVIWYVGLLLPEVTRGWLLHFPIAHLLIMCVSSLLVALSARKLISRARGIMHVVLAVMLPVYGALLFTIGSSLFLLAVTLLQHGVGWAFAQAHDFLVIPFWGLLATGAAYYVVFPLGLLSQIVMKAVDTRSRTSAADQSGS